MKKILLGIAHTGLGLLIVLSFFALIAAGNHGKGAVLIAAAVLIFTSLFAFYEIDRHLTKEHRKEQKS